jgi:RNA polymerase sigma factor (sigma-70 family)
MARPLPSTLARIIGEITANVRRDAGATPALLAQFVSNRDEDAFRGLVQMYAPLVWGVCQRGLSDPNDAEDALQATFIVLARKAGRIARPERLSGWLHGVAVRAARKVREQASRRREVALSGLTDVARHVPGSELRELLDVELDRLPEDLRQAFVLCRIEGKTYAQAADVLGCATSTVGDRVARATELLRERLEQYGLAPVGASLVGVLAPAQGAIVSGAVVDRVVHGALDGPSGTSAAVADSVIRGMSGHGFLWAAGIAAFVAVSLGLGVMAAPGRPSSVAPAEIARRVPVAPVPEPKPEKEEIPPSTPPGSSLVLRLVGKKTYTFDLKGETPEKFAERLRLKDRPAPPTVDLALEVTNTGKEKVSLRFGGARNQYRFFLEGPGVASAAPQVGPGAGPGAPIPAEDKTLEPKQTLTLMKVSSLTSTSFGPPRRPGRVQNFAIMAPIATYWTKVGEYTLFAKYKVGVSPLPEGAADIGDGFGEVMLQTPKIRLQIEAPR